MDADGLLSQVFTVVNFFNFLFLGEAFSVFFILLYLKPLVLWNRSVVLIRYWMSL